MSRIRRITLAAAAAAVTAAMVVPTAATAGYDTPDDAYREQTDISKMFHKLGRGVSNVLFGWIEVPRNIAKEWRKTDPFTGTILGTVQGVVWTVGRTLGGVYDVVSFPFPIPNDYQPLMEPEFVLPTVWGDRLPLYRDEYMAGSQNLGAAVDYGRTVSTPRTDSRTNTGTTTTY
ncbi:MAG: exosortase system-associated protein, TIGR04073 family [Candidatus Sumerlaeia bacterium]|nr:exosortase system-associated protein, TIGR04073 family [Candidatus Sumerlaeia bacterium]